MKLVAMLLILTGVVTAVMACSEESLDPVLTQRISPPPPPAAPSGVSAETTSGVLLTGREVFVDLIDTEGLGPFEFGPKDFSFTVGETIKFVFESESQLHTFTVEDLDIDIAVPGLEVMEFGYTFDKPGEYELICIPHLALGMVGTITVN